MKDINKPMNSLSYLQNDISAVFDDPCCNIKETVWSWPPDRLIHDLRDPYMIFYLSPCIFCNSMDCSHQSRCLVSMFFSQNEEAIKTLTAGYYTDNKSQDCFGFFISSLTFFDFKCGIYNLRKRKFTDKFINEDSSSITDKCVISFFNDDLSSFDFFSSSPSM